MLTVIENWAQRNPFIAVATLIVLCVVGVTVAAWVLDRMKG